LRRRGTVRKFQVPRFTSILSRDNDTSCFQNHDYKTEVLISLYLTNEFFIPFCQQQEGLTVQSPNSRNKCRSAKAKQSPLIKIGQNFEIKHSPASKNATFKCAYDQNGEAKQLVFDGCKPKQPTASFEVWLLSLPHHPITLQFQWQAVFMCIPPCPCARAQSHFHESAPHTGRARPSGQSAGRPRAMPPGASWRNCERGCWSARRRRSRCPASRQGPSAPAPVPVPCGYTRPGERGGEWGGVRHLARVRHSERAIK
jgi:hypothetical protein